MGSARPPVEQVHELVQQNPEGKGEHLPVQLPVRLAENDAHAQAADGVIRSPRQAGYADAHAQDGEGDRLVPPNQKQNSKKRIEEGEAQADQPGNDEFHVGPRHAGQRPQGKGQDDVAQRQQVQDFQGVKLRPGQIGEQGAQVYIADHARREGEQPQEGEQHHGLSQEMGLPVVLLFRVIGGDVFVDGHPQAEVRQGQPRNHGIAEHENAVFIFSQTGQGKRGQKELRRQPDDDGYVINAGPRLDFIHVEFISCWPAGSRAGARNLI